MIFRRGRPDRRRYIVGRFFEVSVDDIRSTRRTPQIHKARRIAAYSLFRAPAQRQPISGSPCGEII
ncbi:MAG: hypothetical protein C0511_14360 [Hyphomicrobium sp.]|nr:hypothetical protein [Hyphomicrobium sp.]